jgi:hypothetical protein
LLIGGQTIRERQRSSGAEVYGSDCTGLLQLRLESLCQTLRNRGCYGASALDRRRAVRRGERNVRRFAAGHRLIRWRLRGAAAEEKNCSGYMQ